MRVYISQLSRYMIGNSSYSFFFSRRFYADKRSSLNHYNVLGVNANASIKDIKAAFYRLSKKYHPDVNTDDPKAAASKFNTISNAYDILNDPIKRREYDRELLSSSSTTDPYVTYNRTSEYAQRARAHRASARQTTYTSNGFNGGFQGNSRSTNHGSYDPNFGQETEQTSDSDNKKPVNEEEEEEFEEKPTRLARSKVFLFSLFLTFSLAAYVTSNLLRTMPFQQPIEEFPSRLVSVSQSTRKSSARI